jgi:hypothetical protein
MGSGPGNTRFRHGIEVREELDGRYQVYEQGVMFGAGFLEATAALAFAKSRESELDEIEEDDRDLDHIDTGDEPERGAE